MSKMKFIECSSSICMNNLCMIASLLPFVTKYIAIFVQTYAFLSWNISLTMSIVSYWFFLINAETNESYHCHKIHRIYLSFVTTQITFSSYSYTHYIWFTVQWGGGGGKGGWLFVSPWTRTNTREYSSYHIWSDSLKITTSFRLATFKLGKLFDNV